MVEINGEWITLQPADVHAAQRILNKSNEPLSLSVEDALRISIGENQTLAKLPVVNFEASGVLQEFIHNITDNQAIQPSKIHQVLKEHYDPIKRGVWVG